MDFAYQQYRLLYETFKLPAMGADFDRPSAEAEVYVLHELPRYIFSHIRAAENHGPFVLSHPDLRWSNIIVEECDSDGGGAAGRLQIKGVIDWEFSATIPRQFFLPPYWISGTEVNFAPTILYSREYEHFHEVLVAKAASKDPSAPLCESLAQLWTRKHAETVEFSLGFLLRHHSFFLKLFFNGIWEHKITERAEHTRRFLDEYGKNSALGLDPQWRLDVSEKYRQYREKTGTLKPAKEESGTEPNADKE